MTYRRTKQLARLLDALAQMERPRGREDEATVVVVIDNDPAGSAGATVDAFRASERGDRVEVRYAIEPTRRPGVNVAVEIFPQ